MLGEFLLILHAKKSDHPMKKYLSIKDFSVWLAQEDGYDKKIPRWCFWF